MIKKRAKIFALKAKGVVDRAKKGTQISSMSRTAYSIVMMNFAFRRARSQFFPSIALDPDCPAELKLASSNVIDSPS